MRFEQVLILILVLGLLAIVAMFATGYLKTGTPSAGEQYIVKYLDRTTGNETTALATKLPNGSYSLPTGRILGAGDKLEVLQTAGTTSTATQCDCCPEERTKPCVEPEPKERYLCSDNRVVSNRGECQNDCDARVVSKIFVCSDGKEVKDPEECGGVVQILYYCANGNIAETPSGCGCSATTAVACVPAVVEKKYKCASGDVVTDPAACGSTDVKVYYICSDQRKVENEADCSDTCNTPVYPLTVAADIPSGAVRIVYECWNGAVVNKKGDCPLYCEKECNCPDYEKPVCGEDGKTYRNRCFLSCSGIKFASDGPCDVYNCIEQGNACSPPAMTAMFANATYCCPGLQCQRSAIAGAITAMVNTNISARYTCQPMNTCADANGKCGSDNDCCSGLVCNQKTETCQERCSQAGTACKLDSECCTGYCNPQTYKCDNAPTCVDEGMTCRVVTGNTVIKKECCSGLTCNDYGFCEKPPSCTASGGACKLDSECCTQYCDPGTYQCGTRPRCTDSGGTCKQDGECCTQYCDPVTYKCDYRPTCYDTYYPCSRNSDCCTGYCNPVSKQCRDVPSCSDSCKDGVRKYDCQFDLNKNVCQCSTESCESQRCDANGKSCAPTQPSCTYEYCSNGVFYSSCMPSATSGQCVCQTQVACQSKRCNTAGTSCS